MAVLRLWFIAGLLAWAGVAHAEPVRVAASVDHDEVAIGEPVQYVLTLEHPADISISWPAFGSVLGEFQIENSGVEPSSANNGLMTEERWYRLVSFTTGSHTIPAPVITYKDVSGVSRQVSANDITVAVTSLLPKDWESLDIRDAKGLIHIRRYGWLWWMLGAIVLVGLCVGFWRLRARRAVFAISAPAPKAPHEIALEELERLRKDALPSRNAYEEYYVRISNIVRSYIEARFSLRAPEMTTEEFLHAATEGQGLSFEHRGLLQEFLTHCDMVKFARYQPSISEAEKAFSAAKRFVNETVPKPTLLAGAG